jgi:hypothetical protein
MEAEDELNATTFQTYLYLVKVGRPVGPRDVMRGANLSSPSVAYRNLQKLIDLGLAVKDEYGNYVIKEKKSVKGYIWMGKTLIPRAAIFGFIFGGVLIAELAVLFYHLAAGAVAVVLLISLAFILRKKHKGPPATRQTNIPHLTTNRP